MAALMGNGAWLASRGTLPPVIRAAGIVQVCSDGLAGWQPAWFKAARAVCGLLSALQAVRRCQPMLAAPVFESLSLCPHCTHRPQVLLGLALGGVVQRGGIVQDNEDRPEVAQPGSS